MAGHGRPKLLDEQRQNLICALVSRGFSRWQAAKHMGVGKTTLFRAIKQNPAFAERLRQSELHQELSPLQKIVEHSGKSWRAASWLLERQKPELYARRAPDTVTLGDLNAIFNAMMQLMLDGVRDQQDRDRVENNFHRFFEELGGRTRSSARVRRAIKKLGMPEEIARPDAGVVEDARADG